MSYIVLAGGALHLRAMRYGWVKVDSALPTWYYSQVAAPCEKSNPTRLLSLLFRWMKHLKQPCSHCIVRSSENRSQKDDSLFSGAPLVLEYTINWMTSSRENNRPLYYSSILMASKATVIIRATPSAFHRCYISPHINIIHAAVIWQVWSKLPSLGFPCECQIGSHFYMYVGWVTWFLSGSVQQGRAATGLTPSDAVLFVLEYGSSWSDTERWHDLCDSWSAVDFFKGVQVCTDL